ncbi:hypothetical protein NPIL_428601, partial [Nephila pilipes]
ELKISNQEKKYYETHPSKDFEKRMLRKCYKCHKPGHFARNFLLEEMAVDEDIEEIPNPHLEFPVTSVAEVATLL